ncbi:hypothetical protein [Streptomyces ziwulingensis]|uniref:Uncharacterized protein n=1 Tax=Streptomyces ziwulingensis TaxID=1045501 RepID=A0ABP9AJC0_9ACTN
MPQHTPAHIELADDITRQLGRLTRDLTKLPPRHAAQLLAHILHATDGVLSELTHLITTDSWLAKRQAECGAISPEVALALGQASNELHALSPDLEEATEALITFGARPAATPARLPTPDPLVIRRRR